MPANNNFPYQRHTNPDVSGNIVCGSHNRRRFKLDPMAQRKLRQCIGELSHILGGCDNELETLFRLATVQRRVARIIEKRNGNPNLRAIVSHINGDSHPDDDA